KEFRDRFALPLSDEDVQAMKFYRPADASAEMKYLRERRAELGGALPKRRCTSATLPIPDPASYAQFALKADGKEMSTTMAAVRLFSALVKDKAIGPRLVPIVADEARTFGMANLFRQVGIYSPVGQTYEPEDAGSMLYYREAKDGQLLEEGITEAGAMSSWTAAATSYSVHDQPMLPFYIYYSMFGFQRVGDLIWAAADQRARGFLLGATAGRTTLGGEGLQHQDGSSHVMAATVPNCRAYDPAFAGELAVIIDHGMRQMLERQIDEFFYITVMNENYAQPSLPDGVEGDVIKGMYRLRQVVANSAVATPPQSKAKAPAGTAKADTLRVRLLGSGTILREVIAAAELLASDWNIASDIFSVTSFSELARDARECERWNRLNPGAAPQRSHVAALLDAGVPGAPIVAATDYVRAYPQLIAAYVRARFVALGTDGFGRSDTRAALRSFFEVDRTHIVIAAIDVLVQEGAVERSVLVDAVAGYGLGTQSVAPWSR
ncbi:MAG: pyruvate dehydrogenase (acetyl-transferring), homodimeric type, partial [Casimicrobiaceae bacterium]